MPDLIVAAIPAFFILIAVELIYDRVRGAGLYRLSDSVNNMSTGIIDQLVTALAFAVFAFSFYEWVYLHWSVTRLAPTSALTWIFALLGVDLLYYWWHRLNHEVNFLWAGHVVHHQSEEYNLSVALRQNPLNSFTAAFFYLPLAVLGVPPAVFFTAKSVMILYQFWIHTRVIGKLGPAELVINTPSHHRVHHGMNPRYIDRNYAGMLIVWDRLFGTFEPESEPVCYGVLKPLRSWNPVWANFQHWSTLWDEARLLPRVRDKFQVWFRHPGWAPAVVVPDLHAAFEAVRGRKFDLPLSRGRAIYLLASFAAILAATSLFLNHQDLFATREKFFAVGWLILSLACLGWVAEVRARAWAGEAARYAILLAALAWRHGLHFPFA